MSERVYRLGRGPRQHKGVEFGVSIVLLVVECKKTDRISSGTEDFPHINSHLTYIFT